MATGSQHSIPSSSSLPAPILPAPQLESLRLRASQIIDSIIALQRTIEAGGHPSAMPAWPDILSKYSILLSQTHNFSTALLQPFPAAANSSATAPKKVPVNVYETIALHPKTGMTDAQLDGEVAPLLRNQQTMDVLRMENETVRRLAEHMNTRGSLGVLGVVQPPIQLGSFGAPRKPEYEDVLKECSEIRDEHDRRVERAVRAVTMLREKFDWKQRVEVEVEEPEELDWDPRLGRGLEADVAQPGESDDDEDDEDDDEDDDDEEMASENGGGETAGAEDVGGRGNDSEDEINIEGALVDRESAPPSSPPVPSEESSKSSTSAPLPIPTPALASGQADAPIEIDDD